MTYTDVYLWKNAGNGSSSNPRWLIHDANDPASPLCQRCHTVDVLSHMDTKLNAKMKGQLTRCIDCHMPGTANTGASPLTSAG